MVNRVTDGPPGCVRLHCRRPCLSSRRLRRSERVLPDDRAILADAAHREHREMRTWVARNYDPEKFEIDAVNKKLARLAKRWLRRERALAKRHG